MISVSGLPASLTANIVSGGAPGTGKSADVQLALSTAEASNVRAALSSEELDEMSEARKERQAESPQPSNTAAPAGGEPGQTISIRV